MLDGLVSFILAFINDILLLNPLQLSTSAIEEESMQAPEKLRSGSHS
jgi:hypothetical protein